MIGTTAVVVDSASYLPESLIERHGVLVAPLSVRLDGHEYLEGVDITASEFYGRLASTQSVTTSQPSPGRLLARYEQAAEEGALRDMIIPPKKQAQRPNSSAGDQPLRHPSARSLH